MPARAAFDDLVCNGGAQGDGPIGRIGPNLPEFVYNGEVAISGISGRMPESANMEEFEEHLMNKEDMVTADDRRWKMGELNIKTLSLASFLIKFHLDVYAFLHIMRFNALIE